MYRLKVKYRVSTAALRLLYIIVIALYLGVMIWLLSGCERRELYVYGDEFRSVELVVNWRKYADKDPDGMTVWFYPLGNEPLGKPYRTTTASVRNQSLYLPGGFYHGVVIDYSPEEYSRQEFLDLDSIFVARVASTPAFYQPDSLTVAGEGVPADLSNEVNAVLFSDDAWTGKHIERSPILDNGLYVVANQPEDMGLDTLYHVNIDRGEYGDYIPYQERDTYQSNITVKKLYSEPETIVWKMRIRVYIKNGFNYLWQMPASISGLANGHYLVADDNTDIPCLMSIDSWELERTGDNSGYIQTTLTTFGLRPGSIKADRELHQVGLTRAGETEPDYGYQGGYDYYTDLCAPDEIRLNLSFVLRDHATVVNYHFDVGNQVVSFDEQLVLRVELVPEVPIDLPYVEAYNGTGFDATVTQWEDGGTVDTTM